MKPLLITIHAQALDPVLSADVITDLVAAVLRGYKIYVHTLEVSKIEATSVATRRLPRSQKLQGNVLKIGHNEEENPTVHPQE